ncbi:MAG: hypothetical protein ACR2LF_12625 [Jatrophihabitantaceae bacterium]
MSAELYATCPTCAEARVVEQPPCAEGHGASCPDRACVECGTALYVDPSLVGFAADIALTVHRAA